MIDPAVRPFRYFVTYLADDLPRRRFLDLRYPIGEDHNLAFVEELLAKLEQPVGGELPAILLLDFQRIERRPPDEGRAQLSSLKVEDRAFLHDLLKAEGAPLALIQRFHPAAQQPNLTAQELCTVVTTLMTKRVDVQQLDEQLTALPTIELADAPTDPPSPNRDALRALVETWQQDRVKAVQKCGEQLAKVLDPESESVPA